MPDNEDETGLIFLSYASTDRELVLPIHAELERVGLNVWIDHKRLLPGQNWDFEINKALSNADLIILFLSKNAVSRRGYLQREVKYAIDKMKEKLDDDVFIIPVKLDDCDVPESLSHLQFISHDDPEFFAKVSASVGAQFERLNIAMARREERTGVSFSREEISDSHDGLPGFSFVAQVPVIRSDQYPNLKSVGDLIRGWVVSQLLREREDAFGPANDPSAQAEFSYGQDRTVRTNLWEAYCDQPYINGRFLSIKFDVMWYGAGAAHPNQFFETFNFCMDPLLTISSFGSLFNYHQAVLNYVVDHCVYTLSRKDAPTFKGLTEKDIREGIESWDDISAYVIEKEGFRIFFPPYQIGPYAAGSHEVLISFESVQGWMTTMLKDGLDFNFPQG